MSQPANAAELAQAARRGYVDTLVRGSAAVPGALVDGLQKRLRKPLLPGEVWGLRETLAALQQHARELRAYAARMDARARTGARLLAMATETITAPME